MSEAGRSALVTLVAVLLAATPIVARVPPLNEALPGERFLQLGPARPTLFDKSLGVRILALLDGDEPVLGDAFRAARGRGSPNQKALWTVLWFGWAARHGSAAEHADAVATATAMLVDQERHGHMTARNGRANEQTTPSHWPQWGLAMAALEIFAWENRTRGLREAELLARTQRWWRAEMALCRLGATPSGAIVLPGSRSLTWRRRDAVREAVYGLLVHGRPVRFRHRALDTASAFLVAAQLARGDDFGGAGAAGEADLPVLRSPMRVTRYANGHVARCPEVADALDPVRVAAVRYDTGEEWYGNGQPPLHFAGRPLAEVEVRGARPR